MTTQPEISAGGQQLQPLRVVVVDDSRPVAEAICEFLGTQPNVAVVGVGGNGLEALALVERTKPDLVLMDLRMPRMNGFHATRQIRRNHPDTVVLMMSSQGVEAEIISELAGAHSFISKSDLTDRFSEKIQRLFPGRP